ncbi:hypothetical protein B0H19DRAFT_1127392 [Mycena capillaripes]|nr:hypothetical protein B0H19DRAFT_1127392 [Mycena capillaripes]
MFSTSWKDDHRPPSLSSSPDQYASDRVLSSPSPSSPIYSFPRIHSGPNSPSFPQDDYHLSWDPPTDPKVTYSLPSFRSLFPSDDEHPLTSEYDASEFSEPDAAQDDSFLTESEDEEQDPFFSDSRVTFTVSAERGRWKSDPLPRHALLRISARTTSPAPSPVPSIVQRNISEPAPSTKSPPLEDSPERQPSAPPLPEHTSPVLSPISLSVSPMVGSVSPLSALEPLSPLSLPPSSLAGDHDMDMDMDLESFPDNDEILTPMESETGLGLFDSPPVPPVISQLSPSSPTVAITEPPVSIEVIETISSEKVEAQVVPDNAKAETQVVPDNAMHVDLTAAKKKKKAGSKQNADDSSLPVSTTVDLQTASRPKKAGRTREKQDAQPQQDKGKKRASQPPTPDEAPKSKKARIAQPSSEASGSRQPTQSRSKRVEVKPTRKTEARDKGKKVARADARHPPPKTKQRKARPRSPSLSASSSRSSSVSPEEETHKSAPELDPELCGMLIECMATSRASSLPMSTLYKTVMQSYPSLKSRGTEHECLEIMKHVLENGTAAGGGSGVFGKVQRNGKDDSDPPLEAHWFYVPDRDQDQERAQLIRSMMPRPAKRTETKKYKQYYYRPLEKISRWDPEDEL